MMKSIPTIIAVLCALSLPSCDLQREKVLDLEEKRVSLERAKREAEEKLRVTEGELAAMRQSRDDADQLLTELRAEHNALKSEYEKLSMEFQQYRIRFHLESRVSAIGETHERLTSSRGRTFKQVQIREVLGDSIQFLHADGAARLALSDLPESWQQRFDYTPGVPCLVSDQTLRISGAAALRRLNN